MRFDTQDLLTLRDGEPMDAERKARVLADSDQVREIGRLEQVQRRLRDLPELSPPPGAWQRIAADLERPPARERRIGSRTIAAAAVGGVALVALAAAMISDRAGAPAPESVTAIEPAAGIDRATRKESAWDVDLAALVEAAPDVDAAADVEADGDVDAAPDPQPDAAAESARLERVLAQIRFQPEVMNAGTAGTIARLEDTLAAFDEQLTFAAAGGLDPHERETLWRERVNVMRALVQVRYSQAQRTGL